MDRMRGGAAAVATAVLLTACTANDHRDESARPFCGAVQRDGLGELGPHRAAEFFADLLEVSPAEIAADVATIGGALAQARSQREVEGLDDGAGPTARAIDRFEQYVDAHCETAG